MWEQDTCNRYMCQLGEAGHIILVYLVIPNLEYSVANKENLGTTKSDLRKIPVEHVGARLAPKAPPASGSPAVCAAGAICCCAHNAEPAVIRDVVTWPWKTLLW